MTECASDCVESLDPRVQIELERLNTSTDEINKLEVELDEARLVFKQLLVESNFRIQQLTKKFGTSIQKSRPYYEARFKTNVASQEMQAAAVQFEKANSAHSAAREMVYLAEQGLCRLVSESGLEGAGVSLDPAWQEMLNHATSRVNQAESERAAAALWQRARVTQHRAAAAHTQQLQHNLKRAIAKSRPYFEEKARINAQLEAQKNRIQWLERAVGEAKLSYARALRSLEQISDEIHRHRGSVAVSASDTSSAVNGKVSVKAQTNGNVNTDSDAQTDPEPSTNTSNQDLTSTERQTKDDSIREWLQHKQNDTSPADSEESGSITPYHEYKRISEKMVLIRPESLPQDFSDKYTDMLTPVPQSNCQTNKDCTSPLSQGKNGQDSSDNWTEINLEYSSPEEISFEKCSTFSGLDRRQIPYERLPGEATRGESVSQQTTPEDDNGAKSKDANVQRCIANSKVSATSPRRIIKGKPAENGVLTFEQIRHNSLKAKLRPDIANWISRSSAKTLEEQPSPTRRQSFDIILNDTGEKVKEIFSQGFMMFNISSLTERRNSEPKYGQTGPEKLSPTPKEMLSDPRSSSRSGRRMPSPLDKTLSYLNVYGDSGAAGSSDDQGSDTDSLASVEMLTDEQIHSLMLDASLEAACSQLLGISVMQSPTEQKVEQNGNT